MNATIPESSQIIIGVASAVLLCSVTFLFVRWLRNTEHPWGVLVATSRKVLPALLFLGIGYMIIAAGWFLFCQLFHDKLPSADRSYFVQVAWSLFVQGAVFVVVAIVCRRIASRTRIEDMPRATA